MNTKSRFLQQWTHVRELGIARFMLVYGVMAWGSTCALLTIFIAYFITGQKDTLFPNLLFLALLWPLCGNFFAFFVFKTNEARFKKLKEEDRT